MLMPYLHFQENCEEAFLFYAAVFGGEIESISRFASETGSPALVGKVMHAQLSLGGRGHLSGSDQEESVAHGTSMELLFHCATADEGRRILEGLAEGGQILSRFEPHPPPDDGGMGALVRDRYGYTWILSAPNTK